MIVPFNGIVVALTVKPELIDRKTGEVVPSKSFIDMLIAEKDGYIVKKISCTPSFQQRYREAVLRMDAPPKPVTLQVDMNLWEMNGRSGLALSAVETK